MGKAGNVWSKWDLHTHTPGTVHNDQFKGDWEGFLTKVESSDIEVLGVTDYYTINGYNKMVEYQKNGRLQNVKLILPNIEIRLEQKARGPRYINFHILFNPCVADQIQENFLNRLSYHQAGTTYYANRRDLINLGYQVNPNVNSKEQAFEEGANNFKVDLNQMMRLLDDGRFRGYYFTIVSGGEDDGVNALIKDDKDQGSGSRSEILYQSDAVFSTNNRMISIMAGKGKEEEQEYLESMYGGRKPVFEGSDAHSIDGFGKKWTWVKSEPSFEGLLQTKFEPLRRIRIEKKSIASPQVIEDNHWIRSIQLDSPDFQDIVIFNPGLNAIIGGKSSGKSILLYELAQSAGISNILNLSKESNWTDPYQDGLSTLKSHIVMGNNSVVLPQSEVKVLYLPQLFINQLSEDFENPFLQKLIRRNLDCNEEVSTRLKVFEDTREALHTNLTTKIHDYVRYKNINQDLTDKMHEIGTVIDVEEIMSRLDNEYTQLADQLNISDRDRAEMESQQQNIKNLQKEIDILNKNKVRIETDSTRIDHFQKQIMDNFKLEEFSDGIGSDVYSILIKTVGELRKVKNRLDKEKKQLISELSVKKSTMKAAADSIKPITQKQERAAELSENRQKKAKAEADKKLLDTLISERSDNNQKMVNIRKEVKELIQSFVNLGVNTASDLCGRVITSNLTIRAVFGINQRRYHDQIVDKFDGRKRQRAAQAGFADELEFNQDEFADKWTSILDETMDGKFDELLSKSNTTQDLLEAESQVPLIMPLDIEKDHDVLRMMSPGKRAIVVLELLLSQQDGGRSPILIDQPEDNLDNRSISHELVNLLRNVSGYRQIIMVTHNANLVVLADADEVLVANQDPEIIENREKRFEYYTGSLENSIGISDDKNKISSKGIRENITDILEGGIEAFEAREEKYLLSNNR